jgi:hypothetical protein
VPCTETKGHISEKYNEVLRNIKVKSNHLSRLKGAIESVKADLFLLKREKKKLFNKLGLEFKENVPQNTDETLKASHKKMEYIVVEPPNSGDELSCGAMVKYYGHTSSSSSFKRAESSNKVLNREENGVALSNTSIPKEGNVEASISQFLQSRRSLSNSSNDMDLTGPVGNGLLGHEGHSSSKAHFRGDASNNHSGSICTSVEKYTGQPVISSHHRSAWAERGTRSVEKVMKPGYFSEESSRLHNGSPWATRKRKYSYSYNSPRSDFKPADSDPWREDRYRRDSKGRYMCSKTYDSHSYPERGGDRHERHEFASYTGDLKRSDFSAKLSTSRYSERSKGEKYSRESEAFPEGLSGPYRKSPKFAGPGEISYRRNYKSKPSYYSDEDYCEYRHTMERSSESKAFVHNHSQDAYHRRKQNLAKMRGHQHHHQ